MKSQTRRLNNRPANKGHRRIITLGCRLGDNKTLRGTPAHGIQFALAPGQPPQHDGGGGERGQLAPGLLAAAAGG